jgi:O-antigen ligase
MQVIKENFWFGTSPANLTDELIKKYKELGFEKAALDNLNSHNQYLETFAGLGIFGFLTLLFIMVYSFVLSIKKRNYLLFFFIIIVSINFIFESMLNRMAGILFMMFFISLLIFADIKEFSAKRKEQLIEK